MSAAFKIASFATLPFIVLVICPFTGLGGEWILPDNRKVSAFLISISALTILYAFTKKKKPVWQILLLCFYVAVLALAGFWTYIGGIC
jgi:hypothetical protein